MLHGHLSKNYYIKVNKSAYHICPYKHCNAVKILMGKGKREIFEEIDEGGKERAWEVGKGKMWNDYY